MRRAGDRGIADRRRGKRRGAVVRGEQGGVVRWIGVDRLGYRDRGRGVHEALARIAEERDSEAGRGLLAASEPHEGRAARRGNVYAVRLLRSRVSVGRDSWCVRGGVRAMAGSALRHGCADRA